MEWPPSSSRSGGARGRVEGQIRRRVTSERRLDTDARDRDGANALFLAAVGVAAAVEHLFVQRLVQDFEDERPPRPGIADEPALLEPPVEPPERRRAGG